ncbi:MAG TPA: hypothetical protein DFS52_32145 [Myxococcales bacterium]|nr:hypothetical protein [Myxococcales bacterium]
MPSVQRTNNSPVSTYRPDPLLKKGSRGSSVSDLQRLLKQAGFDPGPVDGAFGPRTREAVLAFQRNRGLLVDGIVGPQTWGALRATAPQTPASTSSPADSFDSGTPSVTIAPRNLSEAEKFAHYARIVRANGGQVNPDGKPTVLGIRGMRLDGTRHETTNSRAYDDVFVVLTPSGRCYEFRGATHAGQTSSSAAPDVTRDGRGDIGLIGAGNYMVKPNGMYRGSPSFHVQTLGGSGSLAGWRDTNQDGVYSGAERRASEQRGDRITAVLFHPGNASSPRSIGCQTLAPSDYSRFVSAIGGTNGSFSYTLVQA